MTYTVFVLCSDRYHIGFKFGSLGQVEEMTIRYYCEFTLGSAKLSCFIHFNKKKPLFGVYTFYYWTCFKRKAGKNNVFLILSKML